MEPIFKELLCQIEDNICKIVVMTTGLKGVKGILIREEDHLMKGGIPTEIEDLQEEEDHKMMEDPQWTWRTPLVDKDPLMEEDPLMVEDPLIEMEDPQDAPVDKDHQDLEDLLDQ